MAPRSPGRGRHRRPGADSPRALAPGSRLPTAPLRAALGWALGSVQRCSRFPRPGALGCRREGLGGTAALLRVKQSPRPPGRSKGRGPHAAPHLRPSSIPCAELSRCSLRGAATARNLPPRLFRPGLQLLPNPWQTSSCRPHAWTPGALPPGLACPEPKSQGSKSQLEGEPKSNPQSP